MIRHGHQRALAWLTAVLLALVCLQAGAQLSQTKHNLTTEGKDLDPGRSAEICVFCHTPYGADTVTAVPLWNRTTDSRAYSALDSMAASMDTSTDRAATSISVLCLTCHDGVRATNVVVSAGVAPADGASRRPAGSGDGTRQQASTSREVDTPAPLYTKEHPVGVRYGGGRLTAARPDAPVLADFRQPSTSVLNGVTVWWVPTTSAQAGRREKTDLPLYTMPVRNGSALNVQLEPFVECASCHDPHSNARQFLRMSNTGSALCLACHNM